MNAVIFNCSFCDKTFNNERSYEAHTLFYHGKYVNPCTTKESYKQNLYYIDLRKQFFIELKRLKRARRAFENYQNKMITKYYNHNKTWYNQLDNSSMDISYYRTLSPKDFKHYRELRDKLRSIESIFWNIKAELKKNGVVPN